MTNTPTPSHTPIPTPTYSHTPTPTHPHTPTPTHSPYTYTPFSPLLITLIGLLVLLSWNLRGIAQQTANLQIAKAQLGQATIQSAQTEEKLKAMLTDLLALAATEKDPDAAAIVKRYGIKQNVPEKKRLLQNPAGVVAREKSEDRSQESE